jgi:hypothetical protein
VEGRLLFGFNTEGKITSIAHEHGWGLVEMAIPETQPTSAFWHKADITALLNDVRFWG